jgi:hypothetical protein
VVKKRGRPSSGQGQTRYVRASLVPIIEALENGDKAKAIELIQSLKEN